MKLFLTIGAMEVPFLLMEVFHVDIKVGALLMTYAAFICLSQVYLFDVVL